MLFLPFYRKVNRDLERWSVFLTKIFQQVSGGTGKGILKAMPFPQLPNNYELVLGRKSAPSVLIFFEGQEWRKWMDTNELFPFVSQKL